VCLPFLTFEKKKRKSRHRYRSMPHLPKHNPTLQHTCTHIPPMSLFPRIEEERRSSSFASFNSNTLQSEAGDVVPDMMPTSAAAGAAGNGFNPLVCFNPFKCALGIASGMRYLHSHDMVHCDLKVMEFVRFKPTRTYLSMCIVFFLSN
jgi:hypothetical protein